MFTASLTPTFCPAAAKSYANSRGCVRRNACADPEFSSATVLLDDNIMRQLFTRSNKVVYYVTGLRIEGFSDADISPCLTPSRWAKLAGACHSDTALDNATRTALALALQTNILVDTAFVRTINPPALDLGSCTTQLNGVSAVGAELTVDGTCFRQVHPDEFNVYDFGYWVSRHPGNGARAALGRPNPIKNPARMGAVRISFPSSHGLDRWMPTFSARNRTPLLRLLGIYGQEVEFSDLPTTVQVKWLADVAGVLDMSSPDAMLAVGGSQREACGSRYFSFFACFSRCFSLFRVMFACFS